jgi:hypothetical protein
MALMPISVRSSLIREPIVYRRPAYDHRQHEQHLITRLKYRSLAGDGMDSSGDDDILAFSRSSTRLLTPVHRRGMVVHTD